MTRAMQQLQILSSLANTRHPQFGRRCTGPRNQDQFANLPNGVTLSPDGAKGLVCAQCPITCR